MELEPAGSLCALDNPVVAGMQLLLLGNVLVCAFSAILLVLRLSLRRNSLPSWCRAFSVAALALHGGWVLFSVFVFLAISMDALQEGVLFLTSLEFAFVATPSVLGFILALRLRHHAAPDWAPSILLTSSTSTATSELLPRA